MGRYCRNLPVLKLIQAFPSKHQCVFYAILRFFLLPSPPLACAAAVRSPNSPASACAFSHTLHSSTPSPGFSNCHSMTWSRMPLTLGPGEIPRMSQTALPFIRCETPLSMQEGEQLRTESNGGESTASWSLYSSIWLTNAVYFLKRAAASSSATSQRGEFPIRGDCIPWYSPA